LSPLNKNTTMNRFIKFITILSITVLLPLSSHAEELPGNITTGFKNGDASLISGFFKNTVELSINGKEDIYSSTQAEIILKDFFNLHTPNGFEVIHQGGQGASKYAIGSLKTDSGTYRVTLLIKATDSKSYIHQLRIEKDGV